MKYKHIIWDWNGTLYDDAGLCCDITNSVLEEHGHAKITFEYYQINLCHPMIDFYRRIAPKTTDQEWQLISNRFHQLYGERRLECKLHDNSHDVLKIFKKFDSIQSILSAHPQDYLDAIVSHLNLEEYFTNIYGAKDNLAHGKIERGLELVNKEGHSPEDILLIGDTDHDAEVAKSIGANCILIANGFQHKSILAKCGYPVYNSLSQLMDELS